MEPDEVENLLRRLTVVAEHQRLINEDLREFNRQQGEINDRLTGAIERLDVTQARIETLLARLIRGGANGRDA